jgi:hypothetical protein
MRGSEIRESDKSFPSSSVSRSCEVMSSLNFPFSPVFWAQSRSTASRMTYETKSILSQNDIEGLLLSLSHSIAQTSWTVSAKPRETAPVPVSHPNIPSLFNLKRLK